MLTTSQKGAIAEAAIAFEATKLGVGVYVPLADTRYDLIFDLHPRLVRVQCKWASRRGDVIVVPLYTARRAAEGVRRSYYAPGRSTRSQPTPRIQDGVTSPNSTTSECAT